MGGGGEAVYGNSVHKMLILLLEIVDFLYKRRCLTTPY